MEHNVVIPVAHKKKTSFKGAVRQLFIIDQLNTPLGYCVLLGLLSIIGVAIAKFGILGALLLLAACIGIPVVYVVVAYPRIGVFVYLFMAYFIMWFFKLGVNFPLGTLMDGMEALFILSVFIQQKRKKDWSAFKGPISTMIAVWLTYNLVEVANPTTESRMMWLYAIRAVALVSLTYYIFIYYISTRELVKLALKCWIAFAMFAALYAFKQQFVGFAGFEEAYLNSDPQIGLLLFIDGVWRKFSIFSDPVAFSYNMVTASMLCAGLLFGPFSKKKKIILVICIICFIMAMLFSGTRGAYVLPPITLVLLFLLKYSRTLMIIMAAMAFFMMALIFLPTSNGTLSRFQSAFRPNDDPSYNVRKRNQKRIQPYIKSHPLGGGLGATETFGQKFAPHSYLAHFAPDSGYVRVAVELGWIGILIFGILMFTILKTGINNYYRIRDPELKTLCLAAVLVVFSLNMGNIPQEAIVQYPSNVYFYLAVALITVTARLDKEQTAQNDPLKNKQFVN